MQKYKIITTMFLLIFCTSAHSSDEIVISDRLILDLTADDDNNINPETFVPWKWNNSFFSALGYRKSNYTKENTLDGFNESQLYTGVDEEVIRLNIISYLINSGNFAYSIGGDYQQTSIDRVEFGYFHLDNGVIDDFVTFSNNVEIEVTGFSLRGDITYGKTSNKHSARLAAIISPGNTLDVNQSTNFRPIVPVTGQGSSSKSQDLSYGLSLVTQHKLVSFMSIGLNLQYEVLPLNYDVKILAATADRFVDATIDTTETTSRAGLRFVFNHPIMPGLYPVVGVTYQDTKAKDNLSGQTSSLSQTLTTIGLTSRF